MKSFFNLILVLFCSYSFLAFNSKISLDGTINGQVIDAKTSLPMAYVNIIVKTVKDSLVTSGITLEDGTFEINEIPEGSYSLSLQYIGYKTHQQSLTISKKREKLNLGVIKLEEDITALDEVTVIAETTTIQQKEDRKVITIGKDGS